MDAKFHPAIVAIKTGDLERLRELIRRDPTLATSRSCTSHPTLLQCLVLSGKDLPNKLELANVLIAAGAELNRPLGACGSCDNVEVAELILDSSAAMNGVGGWSPLEEALYWNSGRVVDLLVRRGESIQILRIGAGLVRTGLHYAALNGHRAMIEFLIQRGADIHMKDEKVGATPAGWADYGGHPEIRDYLSASETGDLL